MALIGVLAAMASASMMQARISANESSAIASTRTVNSAQVDYGAFALLAIAIPLLREARIAGNETSAIGSLRAIVSAQASFGNFNGGCAARWAARLRSPYARSLTLARGRWELAALAGGAEAPPLHVHVVRSRLL